MLAAFVAMQLVFVHANGRVALERKPGDASYVLFEKGGREPAHTPRRQARLLLDQRRHRVGRRRRRRAWAVARGQPALAARLARRHAALVGRDGRRRVGGDALADRQGRAEGGLPRQGRRLPADVAPRRARHHRARSRERLLGGARRQGDAHHRRRTSSRRRREDRAPIATSSARPTPTASSTASKRARTRARCGSTISRPRSARA